MSPPRNSQPLQKKEESAHPARPPPAFWDNLSEIPLTKNALRELERRNKIDLLYLENLCSYQPRRPIIQPSAIQYLDCCSPIEKEGVKRFARIGGPDLSDLRGYRHESSIVPESVTSDRQSHLGRRKRGSASASASASPSGGTPMLSTIRTKSTGPYDRAFRQHLIDHGVYPNRYKYPNGQAPLLPENLEEIVQAIAQPRLSLSSPRFTQEDFENFVQKNSDAFKESQVMSTVIPIIEGEVKDGKCVAGQVPFTNLEALTDGSLVPGNPDLYYGARPGQLNQQVWIQLNKRIVPSTQHDLPIVPNFFLNAKGRDGTLGVAELQAWYDGALGARGMKSLQTYGDQELDSDNKAYTLTSTYCGGTLTIYASYSLLRASLEMPREYAMTQIKAYALTSDVDTFRTGVSAYRNARDWAKKKRDEAIKKANETATTIGKVDEYVDEDMDIDIPPAKRARVAGR